MYHITKLVLNMQCHQVIEVQNFPVNHKIIFLQSRVHNISLKVSHFIYRLITKRH
jgi:hypothetical protein